MLSFKMEGLLSALIFLSLALYSSHQKQSETRLLSAPPVRGKSGSVKLECSSGILDHGVFWFRQATPIASPQFLLHLSPISKQKVADGADPNRFTARKESSSFSLEMKPFREEDQGTYYCLVNQNSVLHFSTGVQLYYPAVTTLAPTSTAARTATMRGSGGCNCRTAPPTVKLTEKVGLDFSCSLYVWVPLAGIGLLLLIAFLVTISLLCKIIIRRKRCKHHCIKRAMNGNKAGPPVPNRFV